MDGLKDNGSIHTVFGTAIHEAIQEWLGLLFTSEKKAKLFDMETVFKDTFIRLFKENITTDADGKKVYFCDPDTLKEFCTDGFAILNHVRKHQKEFFPTKGFELLGCEIPLEVQIKGNVRFIGYIDIVIRETKTGKVYIYDLKTSKKGWYYEKKDPKKLNQLLLYKKFYSEQFQLDDELIYVKFIILKRKVTENSEWTQKHIAWFEPSHGIVSVKKANKSFMEFVNTTFAEDGSVNLSTLTPTPSKSNCRFCPFNNNIELCTDSSYLETKE